MSVPGKLSVFGIWLLHLLGLTNLSDQQMEEYSNVVGRFGPDSQEARTIREKYKNDRDFLTFADSLDRIKRELGGSGMDSGETSILLGDYADMMNLYGRDSEEAKKYLADHQDNKEFIELAKIAHALRKIHDH